MQLILIILCGISAVIWAFVLVVECQDGTARNWERVFMRHQLFLTCS